MCTNLQIFRKQINRFASSATDTIHRISVLFRMRANRLIKGNCPNSVSNFRFLTKSANVCRTSVWQIRHRTGNIVKAPQQQSNQSTVAGFVHSPCTCAMQTHYISFITSGKRLGSTTSTEIHKYFLLLCSIFMRLMSSGCGDYYSRCVCCSSNRMFLCAYACVCLCVYIVHVFHASPDLRCIAIQQIQQTATGAYYCVNKICRRVCEWNFLQVNTCVSVFIYLKYLYISLR